MTRELIPRIFRRGPLLFSDFFFFYKVLLMMMKTAAAATASAATTPYGLGRKLKIVRRLVCLSVGKHFFFLPTGSHLRRVFNKSTNRNRLFQRREDASRN